MPSSEKEKELLDFFNNFTCFINFESDKELIDINEIPLFDNSFVYFHDFIDSRVKEIRGIQNVLGYYYKEMRVQDFYKLIHVDDRFIIYSASRTAMEKMFEQDDSIEPFKDILICKYRMKTVSGMYKLIERQSCVIQKTKNNIPIKAFSMCTDISSLSNDFRVEVAVHGKYSHLFNFKELLQQLNITKNDFFTKREMEILSLLRLGKSSKEIAHTLYISKYTVDRHRNNMLLKSQTKNVCDLLNFAEKKDL